MSRWLRAVAVLAAICGGAACPALAGEAGTATGVDVLRAYAGTWKVEKENLATAESKAGHESNMLRNDCWQSGGYFVCDQFVNGESKALLVFTYDAARKVYTSYPVPTDGSSAGKGRLMIEGNVWTFPWQTGEGAGATFFRVVNVFVSPARIEFRQEFSRDGKQWTVMARGAETRIATP